MVEDCLRIGLRDLSIDWQYLRARVGFVLLHARETAIKEISEVLAGEHIVISNGEESRSFAWNPLSIAEAHPIEDARSAAAELRTITKSCIHAWAGCYQGILHRLSGGLDSSIVLGCLQDAPSRPVVTCMNYYTEAGSDSDERHFARLAAKRAGCALIEKERATAVDLRNIPQHRAFGDPNILLGTAPIR